MSEWINVKERLPDGNQKVLAVQKYNEKYSPIITACYARKHELETSSEFDDWADYSEEKDDWFCPVGWYEYLVNWDEYTYVALMDGEITHWMPLPEKPNAQK